MTSSGPPEKNGSPPSLFGGGMQPPSVIVIPRPPSATSTSRPLSRRQFALSLRRRDFLPEVDHEDRGSEPLGAQDDDDHFLGTFASITKNDATHDHDDAVVDDQQVITSTPPQSSRRNSLPTLTRRSQPGAIQARESVYTISIPLSHLAGMLIPPSIVIDDERQRRKTDPF
jgi:hypothetical protein